MAPPAARARYNANKADNQILTKKPPKRLNGKKETTGDIPAGTGSKKKEKRYVHNNIMYN